MVTAHGVSERSLARTRALGLKVVEATCPLVTVAHRAVAALARDGYHVVIVGLTAGTSTPDDVIDRVEAQVRLMETVRT